MATKLHAFIAGFEDIQNVDHAAPARPALTDYERACPTDPISRRGSVAAAGAGRDPVDDEHHQSPMNSAASR
jgi:hypothetical protein